MSDFTDAEDRQLVQLALEFSRNGRKIIWEQLTLQMKGTKKPKEALRQRLKTLKRTYGRDLKDFPGWFFRDIALVTKPRCVRASHRSNIGPSTATREPVKPPRSKERYVIQRNMTIEAEGKLQSNAFSVKAPAMPDKSPVFKMPSCSPKCAMTTECEPLSPLLLLASVATTPENQFVGRRCA